MKKSYRLLPLLALVAGLAGCFGSPTGPRDEPKKDTDDGTGKTELVAVSLAAPAAAG